MWAGSDITSSSSNSLVWGEGQTAAVYSSNYRFVTLNLTLVDVVRDGRRPVLN